MQQPPNPYPQYQWNPQQPPFQPQQYQQPLQYPSTPTAGPLQYPPPPPYNVPQKRPSGFRHWFRTRSRKTKIGLGCGTLIAALLLCICAASVYGSTTVATTPKPTPATGNAIIQNTPTDTPTPSPTPTQVPTSTPTTIPTPTPQSINYPPTTEADLRGLAAQGDASAIHEFHSESVGLTGVCPQPKREVTVDPSITGQQLAEDLLAYFYANQLDSSCGSVVFAYHNQSEANDVYTAGRINFDATDSSGNENTDPNATNLKYTLTLDIGGDLSNPQEYTVTY